MTFSVNELNCRIVFLLLIPLKCEFTPINECTLLQNYRSRYIHIIFLSIQHRGAHILSKTCLYINLSTHSAIYQFFLFLLFSVCSLPAFLSKHSFNCSLNQKFPFALGKTVERLTPHISLESLPLTFFFFFFYSFPLDRIFGDMAMAKDRWFFGKWFGSQ